MGKIIVFYGKDGTGKTTLAYALGSRIAGKKDLDLLVHTDFTYPVLRERVRPPEDAVSLGQLLLTGDLKDFSHSVFSTEFNENLFVAGTLGAENCLSYRPSTPESAKKYLETAAGLFNTVLVDASPDPEDTLALESLKAADKVVELIHPNIQGIFFEQSYRVLFDRLGTGPKTLYAAAKVQPFSDMELTEKELGIHFDLAFPNSQEADLKNTAGGVVKGCTRKDGIAYEKELARLQELVA